MSHWVTRWLFSANQVYPIFLNSSFVSVYRDNQLADRRINVESRTLYYASSIFPFPVLYAAIPPRGLAQKPIKGHSTSPDWQEKTNASTTQQNQLTNSIHFSFSLLILFSSASLVPPLATLSRLLEPTSPPLGLFMKGEESRALEWLMEVGNSIKHIFWYSYRFVSTALALTRSQEHFLHSHHFVKCSITFFF